MITGSSLITVARNLDSSATVGVNTRSVTVYCPICEYDKKTLVLKVKSDELLGAYCVNGCDYKLVWREVLAASKGRQHEPSEASPPDPASEAERLAAHKRWFDLWYSAVPIADHPVGRAYLEGRGCVVPGGGITCALRALDSFHHWPSGTRWPAMLAAIMDGATMHQAGWSHMGYQVTYLQPDGSGKAPVEPAKLAAPKLPFHGGVVEVYQGTLDADPGHLGLAEGVESALSLAHLGIKVWATLTAGNMRVLPACPRPALDWPVTRLTIAVDADKAGREAASICGRRWADAGVKVDYLRPESGDINDLIRAAS